MRIATLLFERIADDAERPWTEPVKREELRVAEIGDLLQAGDTDGRQRSRRWRPDLRQVGLRHAGILALPSRPRCRRQHTEIYPTALRTQAGSFAALAKVAGQATSLGAGAMLLTATGSLSATTTVLGLGLLLSILIYAVAFPDTHGRELEDLTRPL